MRAILVCVAAVALYADGAGAQERRMTMRAGVVRSNVRFSHPTYNGGTWYRGTTETREGWAGSVGISQRVAPWLRIEAEVSHSTMGSPGILMSTWQYPLALRATPSWRLGRAEFSMSAGLSASYMQACRSRVAFMYAGDPPDSYPVAWEACGYEIGDREDLAVVSGVAMQLGRLSAEWRRNHGLRNIAADQAYREYRNRSSTLWLGYSTPLR